MSILRSGFGNKKKGALQRTMELPINISHEGSGHQKRVKFPKSLITEGKTRDKIEIIHDDSDDSDDASEDSVVLPRRMPKQKKMHVADMGSFTNPSKRVTDMGEPEDFEETDSDGTSQSGSETMSEVSDDSSESRSEREPNQEKLLKKQQKYEILSKLQQLERRGVTLSKRYSMKSKLHDLQFEFGRVTDILNKESGLKFSRKVLMAFVTGIEFANKKFDPVQAKLEGWSESVMENVEDYDRCLTRLVDKYSGSVEVAPELELLIALVGSGFMFHLSKSILQNPVGILSSLGQENPGMLENVMKNVMKSVRPDGIPPTPQQNPQESQGGGGMTPPSFDVSELLGTLGQRDAPMGSGSESGSSYTDGESDDDDIKIVQVPPPTTKKRR